MVDNWGSVNTLKDTIREKINLYTLNSLTKLPEEREPSSRIILVIEGHIEVSCRIGPAIKRKILSSAQSMKIPAGCWYEVFSNTDLPARFLIIEQESKFSS